MELHFITSTKGKPILVDGGFEFVKDKPLSGNPIFSWRCIFSNAKNCRARLHAGLDGIVTRRLNEHNHSGFPEKIDARIAYNAMKHTAVSTELSPIEIIRSESGELTEPTIAKLPAVRSMQRSLRSARNRTLQTPPEPTTLANLALPDDLLETKQGSVLLYDSGSRAGKRRIVIFARHDHQELLSASQQIHMDESFHAAPNITFQLFTMHAKIQDRVLPLVYCLLPDKKVTTYRRALVQVKTALPEFNPQHIMVDFEMTLVNAARICFSDAELSGCLFHFSQSIIRKTNSSHKHEFDSNPRFKMQIKMLVALAFLPIDRVVQAFYEIASCLPSVIADYFEDTYLGRYRGTESERSQPLFSITFWNASRRLESNMPRTNNHVEGWHNRFNAAVGCAHPSIFKLIKKIKAEMDLVSLEIAQANNGMKVYTKPKLSVKEACIREIVRRVQAQTEREVSMIDALKAFANNISG